LISGLDYSAEYKILVVQIGRIGDMILTTPLFSELKKLFPNSTLTVLANPVNCDVIKFETAVNKILIYKKDVINIIKLIAYLKKEKYDIWIDPKYDFSKTSELLLRIIRPANSFSYNFNKFKFNTPIPDFGTRKHYIDLCLNVLKCFKSNFSDFDNRKPIIQIPEKIRKKEYGFSKNSKRIAVNVSAGSITRIWQREKWLKLLNEMNNMHPEFELITLYMNNEKEIVKFIKDNYKGDNIIYFKSNDILEITDLISKVNLLISPDTSLIHIASAFNIPVIAFYPNIKWNYERFSPRSDISEVIFSDSEKDIYHINTDEVLVKIEKLARMV
jgi:ADP-heptose:LPS heptosyltransferase